MERRQIELRYVQTDDQRADTLTKALPIVKFERMRSLLGVKNLSEIK